MDGNYQLNDSFFSYALHNGANHVMFNLARFVPLIGEPNDSFSVAAVGKIGIGPMLPHAENEIMGQNVDVGQKDLNNLVGIHNGWWQLNGWTTGVEAGFRVNLTKASTWSSPTKLPTLDSTTCRSIKERPATICG